MSDAPVAAVRRRRIWPWVLAASVLALAGLAITTVFLATDPQRVVGYLAGILERDYGVRLTLEGEPELTWLGEVGLTVRGFRLDVIETQQPVMWGESLAVALPWRTLFSDTLEIKELRFEKPVFHAAGLAGLRIPAADQGAGAPLRWPRITSGIALHDARWIGAGVPVATYGGINLELAPLQRDQPLQLAGSIVHADRTSTFRLTGIPRESDTGLRLEDLALQVSGAIEATLQGRADFAAAQDFSAEGSWHGASVPQALAAYLASDKGGPIALTFALSQQPQQPLQLRVQGKLGERDVDADISLVTLPDFSLPLPQLISALAKELRGHAQIDRLQVGPATLEGVRLEAAAPTETTPNEAAAQ